MTWIPTAIAGASALSGFFGGGGNSGWKEARGNAYSRADDLAGLGTGWEGRGNEAFNNFGTDYAANRSALGKEIGYYSQDPNTDARYSTDLNRAYGNTDAQTAAAQMAAEGRAGLTGNIQPGAGGSSSSAGTNAYLAAQGLLAKNNAQVQVANQNLARRQQYMGNVSNLTGQLAGGDWSRGTQALGEAQGIDTNLENFWNGQQEQDYQHDLQHNQMGAAALSGGLQTAGYLYGLGTGGGGAPGSGGGGNGGGMSPSDTANMQQLGITDPAQYQAYMQSQSTMPTQFPGNPGGNYGPYGPQSNVPTNASYPLPAGW